MKTEMIEELKTQNKVVQLFEPRDEENIIAVSNEPINYFQKDCYFVPVDFKVRSGLWHYFLVPTKPFDLSILQS